MFHWPKQVTWPSPCNEEGYNTQNGRGRGVNNIIHHNLASHSLFSCMQNTLTPIPTLLNYPYYLYQACYLRSCNFTKSWYGSYWLRHLGNKETSYLLSNHPAYNVNRSRIDSISTPIWKREEWQQAHRSHWSTAVLKSCSTSVARFSYCIGVECSFTRPGVDNLKHQLMNILGFAGQMVSVATSQLGVVVKSSIENI